MNNQAFRILEFDSLRELIRRGAQTEPGRARVDTLEPIKSFDDLQRGLREVGEAIEIRQRGVRFYFEGIADPGEAIARLRIEGAALEPQAILELVGVCSAADDARRAILAERENCPALFEIVAAVPSELNKLAAAITKKILPSGELDDRASPELARIRHDVTRLRSSITRSLENLMRRSSEAIQEELVTVRNDRFVIPVRADYRGRVNGVAHGSSSSGATIFVEPMQTIEANNELQTLREAEQREIAEILFALSEELRRALPGIESAAQAVAELDFISAKAAFGERFACVVPEVADTSVRSEVSTGSGSDLTPSPSQTEVDASLELIEARHPLLEENLRAAQNEVVPASFKLDGENTTMIISGANAGGKTVVLKTAGLLSLMALSGLPVPAQQARVPFYRSVLADIGDHQSLAANLSTFSSHMANIASMIESCEEPALVLLDEVGTGTDPEEGSALGVAVVDHFKQRGAHVLATTHYSGLKMYAGNEPGVLNASVEFDEKTLRPTYRLLVGLAGASSGLEIARRFGIPSDVVLKASENVKKSSREAIEYLKRIKREADEAEALRQALEEEREAVAEKFAKLDRQFEQRERERQAEFERQVASALAEFENNSRELVAKIQDRADRVKVEREAQKQIAELKREAQRATQAAKKSARASASGSQEAELPAPLRGVRVVRNGKVVSGAAEKLEPPHEEQSGQDVRAPSVPARDIRKGDRVRLLSFGSTGVVDGIKDDEAEVRVGSLHMREKLSNLELLSSSDSQSKMRARRNEVSTGSGGDRVKPSLGDMQRRAASTELHLHSSAVGSEAKSNNELNLIGKKTDEAVDLTDKFLDQAFLNGISEVRIIHGHGTGALRKAIAEFLADHPHVARFGHSPPEKGGSGSTVIELKS